MRIHLKRIYEAPARTDGTRILVDRLWPRGLRKQTAGIQFWARDVAPSKALRRWYRHDPAKWSAFKKKYFQELDANPDALATLRSHMRKNTTFLFSAKDDRRNNAVALKEYLESRSD